MKKKIIMFLVTLGIVILPLTANAALIDEYEQFICLEVKDVVSVEHS